MNKNIIKKDIVDDLCLEFGLKKRDASAYYDQIIATIVRELLAGNRVELRKFGSFKIKKLKGFEGLSPANAKPFKVDDRYTIDYKASKDIKSELNKRLQ